MKIYLQQFLSTAGLASRRAAADLIKQGRVKVNHKPAELGIKIDPKKDRIEYQGKTIKALEEKVYYLVNKPVGYTSTAKDRHALKKVVDLVPKVPKVWSVGRLDKDSHGLIILTNDGELTNKLTHPKFRHEKEYIVTINKAITQDLLLKLSQGVKLEEGLARADKVNKLSENKLSITLHQGWKRQIRRMMEKCDYRVINLERVRIDKIKLDDLPIGKYKKIKLAFPCALGAGYNNTKLKILFMKIKIKKLNPHCIIPAYAHPGDVGLDLYSMEDYELKPGERKIFYNGFALEFPHGYAAIVKDKGSLPLNGGVHTMAGVFDAGYRGEYNMLLINLGDKPYQVKKAIKSFN